MHGRKILLITLLVLAWLPADSARSTEITVEPSTNGAVVKIDGKPFTEYWTRSGTKPILWPIIGPTGKPMTRDYPMAKRAGEATDHPHQRSMWFTHGNVNGVNFWTEPRGSERRGTIRHVKFLTMASGKPATIVTENDWLDADGKKVCEDRRTLRFDAEGDARWIDFDIDVRATEGPVTFADDKEGTFGLRVAQSLSVDAKQGGQIINGQGQRNAAAWGKAAPWLDNHGPIDGETVGIAIFNHPSSFRYPTYWHARTYGLLAANPFGLHEFTKAKLGAGNHVLPKDETMTLRYRVYLHLGDEKQGRVKEAFEAYSQEAR